MFSGEIGRGFPIHFRRGWVHPSPILLQATLFIRLAGDRKGRPYIRVYLHHD